MTVSWAFYFTFLGVCLGADMILILWRFLSPPTFLRVMAYQWSLGGVFVTGSIGWVIGALAVVCWFWPWRTRGAERET